MVAKLKKLPRHDHKSDATTAPDAPEALTTRILRAKENITAPIRSIVAKSQLTEQQWRILSALLELGPMDATRLAEHCSLLLPSQTRIVGTLLDKKLIERNQDPHDRRRFTMEITQAGRAIIEAHMDEVGELYARIEQRLGKKELKTLMELLKRLEEL